MTRCIDLSVVGVGISYPLVASALSVCVSSLDLFSSVRQREKSTERSVKQEEVGKVGSRKKEEDATPFQVQLGTRIESDVRSGLVSLFVS